MSHRIFAQIFQISLFSRGKLTYQIAGMLIIRSDFDTPLYAGITNSQQDSKMGEQTLLVNDVFKGIFTDLCLNWVLAFIKLFLPAVATQIKWALICGINKALKLQTNNTDNYISIATISKQNLLQLLMFPAHFLILATLFLHPAAITPINQVYSPVNACKHG